MILKILEEQAHAYSPTSFGDIDKIDMGIFIIIKSFLLHTNLIPFRFSHVYKSKMNDIDYGLIIGFTFKHCNKKLSISF